LWGCGLDWFRIIAYSEVLITDIESSVFITIEFVTNMKLDITILYRS